MCHAWRACSLARERKEYLRPFIHHPAVRGDSLEYREDVRRHGMNPGEGLRALIRRARPVDEDAARYKEAGFRTVPMLKKNHPDELTKDSRCINRRNTVGRSLRRKIWGLLSRLLLLQVVEQPLRAFDVLQT